MCKNCNCSKDSLSDACRIQSQMVLVDCLLGMLERKPTPKKYLDKSDLNKAYGWLNDQLNDAKKRINS